jgi:F-box domain
MTGEGAADENEKKKKASEAVIHEKEKVKEAADSDDMSFMFSPKRMYGGGPGNENSVNVCQLPAELLEIIFENVPISERSNIALVCQTWRNVLHSSAKTHLRGILKKKLIEKNQSELLICSCENICTCIRIAFDNYPFKLRTKPIGKEVCTNVLNN